MQNQTDSPDRDTTSLSQLAQNMFSSDNNSNSNSGNINNSTIMLAAIVSLLLVILFVLLLHVYAKWFLSHSHHHHQHPQNSHPRHRRSRRRTPATASTRFHHFNIEDSPFSTKGLDSATVSSIPLFVYKAEKTADETGEEETEELECVLCLSGFEDGEIGRSLPKCGHAFHVECIDMWLSSHSNCPICRAPIVLQNDSQLGSVVDGDDDGDDDGVLEIVIGTPSYEIGERDGSVSEENSPSLLVGCCLKRMLSKVFVSSNNGFDGSSQ